MKKGIKKRSLPLLLGASVIALASTSCMKKGCPDPDAINYDEKAKVDDGSCRYEEGEDPADVSTLFTETIVSGDTIVTIKDRGEGTGTMTFTSNKTWVLDGRVFVNSGDVLTIEPGTVIKGKPGSTENASALIVARGGRIEANGTAANPIIMTAESDQLNGNIPALTRGLWGGLIILGNAGLNSSPGQTAIEGIPTTESRGLYGGSNNADNSGTLNYVSVRHGGTDIGAGNEINGITFGGVGSGTTVDNIEVISNQDDGIEFFGGTVGVKHAVVAFCGDDAIDYDEGWRGKFQHGFVVQDPNAGDRMGEHDGGTTPEDGAPYATPVFYNMTYIGRGIGPNDRTITFRDNAGGEYHNSIFANQERGIDIEKLSSGEDSYNRYQMGDLVIADNVFWAITSQGAAATGSDIFTVSFGSGATDTGESAAWAAEFANSGNSVVDPGITYTVSTSGGLNPVPANAGNVTGATASGDAWFDAVTYKGAFDPAGSNWAHNWTLIHSAGFLD